jgi:hypothetical protein
MTALSSVILILSSFTFTFSTFVLFAVGAILKVLTEQALFSRKFRLTPKFKEYEDSFAFWGAWFGTCSLSSVFLSLTFNDVYKTIADADASPVFFVMYSLYLFFMFMWLYVLTVSRSKRSGLCHMYVILAVISVLINMIVILLFLPNCPHYYWALFVFLIPCICAGVATNNVFSYRNDILPKGGQDVYRKRINPPLLEITTPIASVSVPSLSPSQQTVASVSI